MKTSAIENDKKNRCASLRTGKSNQKVLNNLNNKNN